MPVRWPQISGATGSPPERMEKILVSWRDIPSQIIVKRGRQRAKALLGPRFQQAVDRAAMRARKRSEDAYLSEWARQRSPLAAEAAGEDLQALADRFAREIDADYSDERLLKLIKNHGWQPMRGSAGERAGGLAKPSAAASDREA